MKRKLIGTIVLNSILTVIVGLFSWWIINKWKFSLSEKVWMTIFWTTVFSPWFDEISVFIIKKNKSVHLKEVKHEK